MIPVAPPPEPGYFDAKVRQPGQAWLNNPANDGKRPADHWTHCCEDLREGFQGLCGYGAMWLPEGTVDHYLSCKNHRDLAYEWSNYRFVSARINSRKGSLDDTILDPFEVGEGWFEVILPSMQLIVTSQVPTEVRSRALDTVKRLKLGDGAHIERQRWAWYELHKRGELLLSGLRKRAPLVARAVDKWKAAHPEMPLP